jgi:type II secretory pathway component PulM
MKGFLSLDQELRAVRRAQEQKGAPKSTHLSNPKETERPWQPDIDEIQQTMREVLRAVAGFSGVELPGLPSGLQDNGAVLPSLDIKTLKDRFRNDLEGFSVKTTEELTRRAREHTHAAIDGVQNEVGGRIEKIAAEFRENLQLPAQIEKLLEPCVGDAEARLERSVAQKFEQVVAHHERLVQEKLEAALNSVHAQISTLEQTMQEVRELKAEAVAMPPAEPAIAAADVEDLLAEHERSLQEHLQAALTPVHAQISTLEQTMQEVRELKAQALAQPSAEPVIAAADVEDLLAEHERSLQERLQAALEPVHAQISTLEQTMQEVRELKAELVAKSPAEPPMAAEEISGRIDELAAEFREKLQAQGQIEKLWEPRIEKAAARLEKSICQKVEQLVARHEQLVEKKLQGTLNSVQAQISALEQTVRQFRALKAEPVAKLPAEQSAVAVDCAAKNDESSLNTGLKGFLDQAFSRIELSFNKLPESLRMPPAQDAFAGLGEQHNAIPFQDVDREARIQQALDYLGQLGPKDPYPVS